MGMAASQARLGLLTARKADIEWQESNLANQKTALSRDMQRVTRKYREALNQKSVKWTNNSGVSYVDMSYKNLMQPCVTNQQKPYLITDLAGKVVVDSKYLEYAQMISPDGSAGGSWEDARSHVLAQLTGFDEDDLEEYAALERAAFECHYIMEHTDPNSDEYDEVKRNFDEAQDAWNKHKLYTDETKIAFYDQLFQAIADCGWTYDSEAGDTERLNQMFQNNLYTITTIDRDYDENGEYTNTYINDIASNNSHVVLVNDSVANADALAEYEYQKRTITAKETRIDNRMNNLETEMSAITKMIEGIQQVLNDNEQKYFAVFNG